MKIYMVIKPPFIDLEAGKERVNLMSEDSVLGSQVESPCILKDKRSYEDTPGILETYTYTLIVTH